MTSPVRPYRSRLLLPETLPFTDARERRWFYNYRGAGGPFAVVSDPFNREDSATSLGTADTGQAWTALSGTWGISGNQAYHADTTGVAAYINAGVADCTVSARIATLGGEPGLFFRVVDAQNWWRCILSGGNTLILQKVVVSAFSTVKSQAVTFALGDRIGVRLRAGAIDVLLRGSVVFSAIDTDLMTATKHGIGCGSASTASRWDDFLVTVP